MTIIRKGKRLLLLALALALLITMLPLRTPIYAADNATNSEESSDFHKMVKINSNFGGTIRFAPGDATYYFYAASYFPKVMEIVAVEEVGGVTYYQVKAAADFDWAPGATYTEYDADIWIKSTEVDFVQPCEKCGEIECGSSHENWCEFCKVDDCDKEHITSTVTDIEGNPAVDAGGNQQTVSVYGYFPNNTLLNVTEYTNETAIEEILIQAGADEVLRFETDDAGNATGRKFFDMDVPFRFLDLSLNHDGVEIQPDGKVTVSMDAVSLGLADGEHFMVYHIHPNGDGTYTNGWLNEGKGTVVKDGKISFQMDQFSYVLVFGSSTIVNENAYFIQSYYETGDFPEASNGNLALLGVYVEENSTVHVLIANLSNNAHADKIKQITVNGVTKDVASIAVYYTGKISNLVQKDNNSNAVIEQVVFEETNLRDNKGSKVRGILDVTVKDLVISEMFEMIIGATAGGFDIGKGKIDLKLEFSITKDVVSIDGDTTLSGNSVVLPITLTQNGGMECKYFGKEIIYRIAVRNTGTADLTNVKVSDVLPAGLYQGAVYTSPDGTNWTQATVTDGKIEVATVSLEVKTAQNYYVKVTMADSVDPKTYTNTAELNVNNVTTSATAEIIVQNPTEGVLTISKEVTPALPAIIDSVFTFTLTGDNGVSRTFTLRHGESTSFILPVGSYTVTEAEHSFKKFEAQSETQRVDLAVGGKEELNFVNKYVGAEYFQINYVPIGSGTVTVKYESVSIDEGDKVTYGAIYGSEAENFTGAEFLGWYADEGGNQLLSKDAAFVPEMPSGGWESGETYTYYAKFALHTHTITWIVDDVKTVETYEYGATIVKPTDPTKEGHKFAGWGAEVPANMPDDDLTFTAQWEANSYTVTWIVDGVNTVETYEYGAAIKKPDNPSKPGYNFVGWTPEVPATMPAENLTFTAQFELGLTSLKIKVTDCDEVLDPNQSFLFTVTGEGVNLKVTIQENGSVTIDGLTIGEEYTIKIDNDWSWRYKSVVDSITVTLEAGEVVTFTVSRENKGWLDGDNWWAGLFHKD